MSTQSSQATPIPPNQPEQGVTAGPRIALTAKWATYPDRFDWIRTHGFALEYTPSPSELHLLPHHVGPMLNAGIPVRYHGFFPDHDLGHQDAEASTRGLQKHLAALDALQGYGEQVITVHIGLSLKVPIDTGRAVENLARLVEYGKQRGITVCLENLRRGVTSDPRTVAQWANQAGAMITLDIGHALSCQHVLSGAISASEFVATVRPRLREIHLYERETDRHYPPRDMHILGPILDDLPPACDWWTIELDDYDEALHTRALAQRYLSTAGKGPETAA